jgi:tetratricopeptide (TPR) repeat protein
MAIKGSLKEASLADVCQLLALGFKTGCLSVADGSRFGQIFFDRGRITFARIVNRRDRLGDLLVRDGVLTQERLDEVLEQQGREPDRRLGELLVERSVISRSDLGRYVRIQIEEAIYHLFTWSRGNFYFEVDEKPDADILVSINPESLMLEAARRVDEWSVIEKKIPSLDLIFEVERARLTDAEMELSPVQLSLVPLFDGTRTVEQVVDATGFTEFDVGKALFGLIQSGYAHRVGRRSEEPSRVREVELQERRNLGVAFFRTGMLQDATREFERVLRLEPTDLNARFHLALIALRSGKLREAVRQLRTLLEESGPNFPAYVNLAIALRALGRTEDSLLVLDEAEALRPGNAATALARGVGLLHAHKVVEARAALAEHRQRLGESGASIEYFYHAALAAALLWEHEEAEAVLRDGLERHPTAAPLLLMLGLVREQRNDLDDAETLYRRALEEEPALAQAHKALGDIAYRRGSHEEALAAYARVIELDPEFSDDVYARMGNLHYKRRRVEAAVTHWNHALQLNPHNTIVRNNIEIAAHVP